MTTPHPNDVLRNKLRTAMNRADDNALRQWAMSGEAQNTLQWKLLHEAWAQSTNKAMLAWPLLCECINLAHANHRPVATSPLSTLHAFATWMDTPEPRWIEHLGGADARDFIEQAVAWRLMEDRGDAYSMQCMETAGLFQLSVGSQQGWIWRERFSELSSYPMECAHAMECTEKARCTDWNMYAAIWAYQQVDTTRAGWKREMLGKQQMHNLAQLSDTSFVACEYVIEQHAQYDCRESYGEIVARSNFPVLEETDAWMLAQLTEPSGTWETAGCPSPDDRRIQAWWYSLQLGVDDIGLLQILSNPAAPAVAALPLPEGAFTPP